MLRASRFKWAVLFIGSGAFALCGVLIFFAAPGGRLGGIVVFGFFGACAVIAALLLVFRATLVLSPTGFSVNSLGRHWTRRWEDIDSFVVIRPAALSEMVGINFRADYAAHGVRTVVRNVVGYESALPDTFGMKAKDLVTLLNEWRNRHSSAGRVDCPDYPSISRR